MPATGTAFVAVIAVLPLVGWSLYRRVKRLVGRQRLLRARPWVTLLALPLLLALLAGAAYAPPHPRPMRLAWLAGALVLGGALALWSLRRTRFEAGSDGLFYTPDSRIGIAISALFIARIAYRLADLAIHGAPPPHDAAFALSPYTLAPVGLLSGYLMVYAAGLVRARSRMLRAQRQQQETPT